MASELLVPRNKIQFAPTDGRFVEFSAQVPDILRQPHVRASAGEMFGVESGKRSGLLRVDEQLYKIKGCRPSSRACGFEPWGTQTFSLAQYEADKIAERREAFIREGVDYPLEPVGFWVYDDIQFKGEPTAATLYRAKGDTRLDEFLWWVEKQVPYKYLSTEIRGALLGIIEPIGVTTGQMLRFLHQNGFTWDSAYKDNAPSNAHTGNVVIFPDSQGYVSVGLVDFDNSITHHQLDVDENEDISPEKIQEHDYQNLRGWFDSDEVHEF